MSDSQKKVNGIREGLKEGIRELDGTILFPDERSQADEWMDQSRRYITILADTPSQVEIDAAQDHLNKKPQYGFG